MKTLCLIFFLIAATLHAAPEDWLGKKVPQLVLENGKTYSNVTFSKIEADAVTITHAGGILRIPMESLRAEAREALGYDPAKAEEARKQFEARKGAAAMANAERLAEEEQTKRAEEDLANQIAKAVPMTYTVSSVDENGFVAYQIEWRDQAARRGHSEDGSQYISIEGAKDFEIYEDLKLNLHAIPKGTIERNGRVLKHWLYLPRELAPKSWDGLYPSDFR